MMAEEAKMGEGAQGHQLGQSAVQRESMDAGRAAEATVPLTTIREHEHCSTESTLDAAAAHKRWRTFASRQQGLAPIGRVVVRARRAQRRRDVVSAALGAADSWARGDRGASIVWAAHGSDAAADAFEQCKSASERNAKRAVEAREALGVQNVETASNTENLDRPVGQFSWPPKLQDRRHTSAGNFTSVPWMKSKKLGRIPGPDIAWDRVLRVVGTEPKAAAEALKAAAADALEAAAVAAVEVRGPKTQEGLLALKLCAWAQKADESLRERKSASGGLTLPPEITDEFNAGYVLTFGEAVDANANPVTNQVVLSGALHEVELLRKGWFGGAARGTQTLTTLLDDGVDEAYSPPLLLSDKFDGPSIVHRMLLDSVRRRRSSLVRRAVADGGTSWAALVKRRGAAVREQERLEGIDRFKRGMANLGRDLRQTTAGQLLALAAQQTQTKMGVNLNAPRLFATKKTLKVDEIRNRAKAAALRRKDGDDDSDDDDPEDAERVRNWSSWLLEKRSHERKTLTVADVDEQWLQDAYCLYLYDAGSGGAMPEFFPGDLVNVYHPYAVKTNRRRDAVSNFTSAWVRLHAIDAR